MKAPQNTQIVDWVLVCESCDVRLPIGAHYLGCPACQERGEVGLLEFKRAAKVKPVSLAHRQGHRGLSRYLDLLPCTEPEEWISLGEGGTSLVPSRIVGPALGLSNLWFKLEQQNPTLSFKDRFVSVTVNAARSFGYQRAAVSSTGNLGISAAAYCAAAGMDCLVIVPDETPDNIIAEANLHGARVVVLDKATRFKALEIVAAASGWYPIGLFLPRAVQNPFGIEGYKTFAYEVIESLGSAPAAMLFPCARGNGLYGSWKGFQESLDWGWIKSLPRMVACQPMSANSLEVSLKTNSRVVVELPPFESVAKSVSESVASDKALRAIRDSGGTAVSATDAEIKQSVRLLGKEGLNVEAGSALTVACLARMRDALRLSADAPIVCVLTASGIRWPEQARWVTPNHHRVSSLDELRKLLEG